MTSKATTRLYFVAKALNLKLTDNALLANNWFCDEGRGLTIEDALQRFNAWMGNNPVCRSCRQDDADSTTGATA